MIVSASRRTDIPAYYADWFFARLAAGWADVRNPMAPSRVSRVALGRQNVDGFVFWTRDATPMLERLWLLRDYPFYFQFTLNPYGRDVEPGAPDAARRALPAFRRLAQQVGRQGVVWRYDPILLGGAYTLPWHIESFARLAAQLEGCCEECTVSFVDMYRGARRRLCALGMRAPTAQEERQLLAAFVPIARAHGLRLATCAEPGDYADLGVERAACIDVERLARIGGQVLDIPADGCQRPACGCAASVDIGAYDTCPAGCRYCYADHGAVAARRAAYDPASPLLCSAPAPGDHITLRGEPQPRKRAPAGAPRAAKGGKCP